MAKLKTIVKPDDKMVLVHTPVSSTESKERLIQYNLLTPKQFGTKFKGALFLPVEFSWNGEIHQIQYNFCVNSFCKWHGLPQQKFTTKSKSSRYKLSGTGLDKTINCNPDPVNPSVGASLDCHTSTLSNWSIAEEIARLVRIESIQEVQPDYQFHKVECVNKDLTPFSHKREFYKQGKSKVGAPCWQCKMCKKKTNLLPNTRQTTSYKQKRNEILPTFAKLLLNRTPVARTCEILNIGRKTYYQKLELLYLKCLEFLKQNENKPLHKMEFDEMWLNTDKMTYHLNNVRKKGQGGSLNEDFAEPQFPTNVVITAEVFSRYVFRADTAYDWGIQIEEMAQDTTHFKDDHLNNFAKKYARFPKYSHFPQPPSKNDTQPITGYKNELLNFERRMKYVNGLHVNSTYTTIAHYWIIKHLVKASQWRFITDKDHSLMTSIYRVFCKEFKLTDAHHFLCQTDKTKSRKEAFEEFKTAKQELTSWGVNRGISSRSIRKLAHLYLEELFQTHKFHKEEFNGRAHYLVHGNRPIDHPLALIDRGFRSVDCTTNLSSYGPKEMATMILNVSDNATNTFIQTIRRRLSILERPLTTARGDGKSYIYSNFNPKYAHMSLTVLRTYYNFCLTYKSRNGEVLTPAQRLGLTDKQFSLKDIIYFR